MGIHSNDSWHFDVALSYDFNFFLNQNMIRSLRDRLSSETRGRGALIYTKPEDLMLHGLTLTMRFDF